MHAVTANPVPPSVEKRPLTLLEGVVHVEQRQVVAVDVSEPQLGLVSLLLHLVGPHEALRN